MSTAAAESASRRATKAVNFVSDVSSKVSCADTSKVSEDDAESKTSVTSASSNTGSEAVLVVKEKGEVVVEEKEHETSLFEMFTEGLFCFRNADYNKARSEEHTSELQSPDHLVCRLLLEKKKNTKNNKNKHNILSPTIELCNYPSLYTPYLRRHSHLP